jgi:hypothetical protein
VGEVCFCGTSIALTAGTKELAAGVVVAHPAARRLLTTRLHTVTVTIR